MRDFNIIDCVDPNPEAVKLVRDEDNKTCDICNCTFYGKHVCRGKFSQSHKSIVPMDENTTHERIPFYGSRLHLGFKLLRDSGWDCDY